MFRETKLLRRIAAILKANGPATVFIAWVDGIASLGTFRAESSLEALRLPCIVGAMIVIQMTRRD